MNTSTFRFLPECIDIAEMLADQCGFDDATIEQIDTGKIVSFNKL